jgi:ADP-ribose pyrophosphatase YjhB (NUDIX family)
MMQRYIVFLNDRAVSICQDINITELKSDTMTAEYTDKYELHKVYNSFYKDKNYRNLLINSGNNFNEACVAFNSFFKIIKAAGGIVRNQKEDYLFIKRLGLWDLPKGKLHKKESAQDGALREVTEETGLTNLTITKLLPSTFHIYTDRKDREILKETYWFEMDCMDDQEPIPQTEEDITEVKWFTRKELNIPLENTYASLRQLLAYYIQY